MTAKAQVAVQEMTESTPDVSRETKEPEVPEVDTKDVTSLVRSAAGIKFEVQISPDKPAMKTISLKDLAAEARKVESQEQTLALHMYGLWVKFPGAEQFQSVCRSIEAINGWKQSAGRLSKEETDANITPQPLVWKQYKSYLMKAAEAKLIPGNVYTIKAEKFPVQSVSAAKQYLAATRKVKVQGQATAVGDLTPNYWGQSQKEVKVFRPLIIPVMLFSQTLMSGYLDEAEIREGIGRLAEAGLVIFNTVHDRRDADHEEKARLMSEEDIFKLTNTMTDELVARAQGKAPTAHEEKTEETQTKAA